MRNLSHYLIISLVFISSAFIWFKRVRADDLPSCSPMPSDPTLLSKCIADINAKLTDLQGQTQTLAKTILYLNTKIQLAQVQIVQTEANIQTLQAEVTQLSGKITVLDSNLGTLSQLLVNRIHHSYIQAMTVQPMYLLLTANGFGDFLERYKYFKVTQKHDQIMMTQLETNRTNFDIQKQQKVEKQTELQAAQDKLVAQKSSLNEQQQEKQSLLQVTQNSESRFQDLLNKARAQLAAIRSFVTANGGASILNNQTKCDDWGCYYNQRDALWGNEPLGSSSLSVAEYGCLVTSVAMVAKHNGKDIKPIDIARTSSAFFNPDQNTALLQWSFSVNGVNIAMTSAPKSQLDSLLSSGKPVIVGLFNDGHFIVIKRKSDKGYIMDDPFLENGYDKEFTDTYSLNNINSLRLVSFN